MEELVVYRPNRVYLYALIDPRNDRMFYVGQT
jgi:hypothetical protein